MDSNTVDFFLYYDFLKINIDYIMQVVKGAGWIRVFFRGLDPNGWLPQTVPVTNQRDPKPLYFITFTDATVISF